MKNSVIQIFCIPRWFAVPFNLDKWNSMVLIAFFLSFLIKHVFASKGKGKGKVHILGNIHTLQQIMKAQRRSRDIALSSTSALFGGGWSMPRPGCFTPEKKSQYLLYRRLGGPQGRSGGCAENLDRDSIPRPSRA